MVPQRFVVEYPRRCRELLSILEPLARERRLVGSFSLLMGSAIFTIPYERLRSVHPLAKGGREAPLYAALRRIEKQNFLKAEFWKGAKPEGWRFSRILSDPGDSFHWQDEQGVHPFSGEAKSSMEKRSSDDLLRVLRNALAHGNVLYLDKDGLERRGATVQFLAFLSRYEETDEQKAKAKTFRLVAATEDGFLAFVHAWVAWLEAFPDTEDLLFGTAAA